MFSTGQKVNRIEDREVTGATVLEVTEDSIHISYDEGGDGWWPLETLIAVTPE